MKLLDRVYQIAIIFIISMIAAFTVMKLTVNQHDDTIYVVDLARISNAENMVAIKAQQNKSWMDVVSYAGKDVKGVIQKLANGHTVIVKQAVVTGTGKQIDITDNVLQALSLPLKTPAYIPSRNNTLLGVKAPSQDEINAQVDSRKDDQSKTSDSIFPLQ
ncbi:MAG: hypothetical protein O2809_00825 [Proteobacteria bacterium]|nr:hypothetical protein [Pseudomonadota bacterium]